MGVLGECWMGISVYRLFVFVGEVGISVSVFFVPVF